MARVCGVRPGPTLAVFAGVHGCEYPGIEAATRLYHATDPGSLRGMLIIVPVANEPAFFKRVPYVCPVDGQNLNRVFPGREDGSYSERLAWLLFQRVARQCDCLVDLHGGDVPESLTPFVIIEQSAEEAIDRTARSMARAYGTGFVVVRARDLTRRPSSGTSSYCAAAEMGKPAILAEAGGEGRLDEGAVEVHLKGLSNVMKLLGMLEGDVDLPHRPQELTDVEFVTAQVEGVFRPAVRPGQAVAAHSVLGTLGDPLGTRRQDVITEHGGVVLYQAFFPPVQQGELVVALGRSRPEASP